MNRHIPVLRDSQDNGEDVERGEAKASLMQVARDCDLFVPQITINSFHWHFPNTGYRKVLGPPFTVSFDAKEQQEVAVTLFNSKHGETDDEGLAGLPWQWQTFINPIAQVRCVMVGGRIRAYRAGIEQFGGKSFREAQADGHNIKWSPYNLPSTIAASLLRLSSSLSLSVCCPEFLIDENDRHIFIDLNPCGDWCGFVSEEENRVVAEMIVDML